MKPEAEDRLLMQPEQSCLGQGYVEITVCPICSFALFIY